MADYGQYRGAIKATFEEIIAAAIPMGADSPIDISIPAPPQSGATYIVCEITTTGDTRVEIGGVSTATSFKITSADTLICTVATDRPIGLWGDGGTPTVTIKRMIVG